MELPILLKEKLEQEIDEIELKKLKQSAQNISEKYRDKSSNKMSTRLIASREDAVAYAVSRMPATYGAVCFALKHSLEMMPNAEIIFAPVLPGSSCDAGAGRHRRLLSLCPAGQLLCDKRNGACTPYRPAH